MDVHKPKPWHGLREFLREYAIVVVGVLTALAGEQIVVAADRAHAASTAEEALRQEVGVDLVTAAERVMVRSCLMSRLSELSQRLNAGDEWRAAPWPLAEMVTGKATTALPQVYRAPIRLWGNAAWQAVTASGEAALLSQARLKAYGSYYREIEQLRDAQSHEEALIPAVQPLAHDQSLSADKRVELEATLADLDRTNFQMVLVAEQLIERARRDGLPPDAARVDRIFQYATAHFGTCVQRLGSTADALPPDAR